MPQIGNYPEQLFDYRIKEFLHDKTKKNARKVLSAFLYLMGIGDGR